MFLPPAALAAGKGVYGIIMESFIGNCLWLIMCTRPDIQKQLKPLSRYPKGFGKRHVLAAKQILKFLKWSIDDTLTYRAGYSLYYQVFTDASHASTVCRHA